MEPITNAQSLGALVRAERKRQGFTQAEFAGLCGVGTTFLSQLENGKPTAEIDKALHVAAMLGIDLYAQRRAQ